ncbi:MAG: TonB-dependent receptor [Acidobacteria bacterium]|nr:TonB-dependent receptor [Acidobacteriota bacterium]
MFFRGWRSHAGAALVLVMMFTSPTLAQEHDHLGVLVIAHGADAAWNAPVLASVEAVRREMPAAVGFLMGDGPTPQAAYDALVRRGASRIVVVPLLISSHSAHYEQIRFLAGLRPDYPHAEHMALAPIAGPVPIVGVTPAMDDDALIGDILADRARALSANPARERLTIVAHGPNDDGEARVWLAAMRRLAARVQATAPFAAIDTRLLRDDAPKPVKDLALSQLREAVAADATSGTVVVIPLLLSPGRVADEIPQTLKGLAFAWDGRTLLPDGRIAQWILKRASVAGASAVRDARSPIDAPRQIEGTVTDASGLPVVGAAVVLRRSSSGVQRVTTTGRAGQFAFHDVADGPYDIVVSLAGFAPVQEPIDASIAEALSFVLQPLRYQEAVTVTSDARLTQLRDSTTLPVTVIEGQAMRDAGHATVGAALGDIAGIVTRRGSEGTDVAGEQVQGLDPREVLVLMDGQPIAGARGIKSGMINLDEQPVHALDRIEVVRGAASALYGSDAIGGVINLIPRDPRHPLEASGALAGGSFGTADASADLGGLARWGTWSIGGGRHARDGFDLTPSTPDTTGTKFGRTDFNTRATVALSPQWSITGTATSDWNHQTGQSNGELGTQANLTDANAQTYGARALWQAEPDMAVEFRAYRSRYAERSTGYLLDPAETPVEPGDLFEGLSKLDASVFRTLDSRQQLRGGVEWMRDAYRGHNRLRDADGNAVTMASGWAEYSASPLSRVTVTTGVRADAHSTFGSAVSPKVAVVDRVTDWLTGRVSFGRGFRAPDLGQLYYRFLNPTNLYQVIGNPHLEPERSTSWQGGIETAWGARAHASVNIFNNDVRHLIQAVNLGFVASAADLDALAGSYDIAPDFNVQLNRLLFLYENVAHARTRGVDLAGDVRLSPAWRLSGSYTFLDAVDVESGAALTNRNRHHGTMRLDWTPARLGVRANLRGAFYSSWIAGTTRGVAGTSSMVAPRFALWDLNVSKTIRRPLELFAGIDNLTDNQDPNTGKLSATGAPSPIYRPEIGRTFETGVRWSWNR